MPLNQLNLQTHKYWMTDGSLYEPMHGQHQVMPTLTLILVLFAPWPTLNQPVSLSSDWLRPPVTRITPPDQLVRQMDTGQPAMKVRRLRLELLLASLRQHTFVE